MEDPPSRQQELRQLVLGVIRARATGEHLPDEAVIAKNAHLMPELLDELANVRMIQRAQALADALPHGPLDEPISPDQPVTSITGPPTTEDRTQVGLTLPNVHGYRITGRLGAGGMGVVWRAVQLSTKRVVALKLMSETSMASPRRRERFLREIQLCAALEHPHIVRIYDSGYRDGVFFYAMELIQGQHLDDYVGKFKLPTAEIVRLMMGVCRAVQFAHQRGIIHRDLKPSNILITSDGQPHLVDFGLAKAMEQVDPEEATISREGEVAGTLAYMAPEQAGGRTDEVDTRADVYSLGVVLYRLITGRSPHDLAGSYGEVSRRIAESEVIRPRSVNRAVDGELEAILLKSLAHEPDDRYATAAEFANDLNNYLEGEPLTAKPPTTFYFLRKRFRKYRGRVSVALAVILILLGMLAMMGWRVKVERDVAVRAEGVARKQRALAEAADQNSRTQFATLAINNAYESMKIGELGTALLWYVEALKAHRGQPEQEKVDRVAIGAMLRTHPKIEQVWFDGSRTRFLHFLRDGAALLSANDAGVLHIRDVVNGQELVPPFEHHSPIRHPFIGAGETRIVTTTADGTVRVIDAQTGAKIAEFANGGPVRQALVAPDGKHAMGWTQANAVRWWDVGTGKLLSETKLEGVPVGASFDDPAHGSDGTWMVVVTQPDAKDMNRAQVRVWNVNTGQPSPAVFDGGMVYSAVIVPDQRICIGFVKDRQLTLQRIGLEDGKPIGSPVDTGALTIDGTDPQWFLYAAGRVCRAFDRFAWKPLDQPVAPLDEGGLPRIVAGHQLGLIIGGEKMGSWFVQVRDFRAQKLGLQLLHESFVTAAEMDPSRQRVTTATESGIIRMWSLERPQVAPGEHLAAHSTDGHYLVTSVDGGRSLRAWDLTTRRPLGPALHPEPPEDTSAVIAISDDGGLVAALYLRQAGPLGKWTFMVWDVKTGKPAIQAEYEQQRTMATPYLIFDPARRVLLVHGSAMRVLSLKTFEFISTPISDRRIFQAQFSDDGRRLLVVEHQTPREPAAAQVWDPATWNPVTPLVTEPPGPAVVAISRDGAYLAHYSPGGGLEIRAIQAGAAATGPATPPLFLPLRSGEFQTNGKIMMSPDKDGIRMIDVTSRRVLTPRFGTGNPSLWIMSADGRWVVREPQGGRFELWDATTAHPLLAGFAADFAAFTPDSDGVLLVTAHSIEALDLSLDQRPVAALQGRAELLSAQSLDSSYTTVPLSPKDWQEHWNTIAASP